MTYTVETIETIELDECPHIRARIVLDEDPMEPENDGQSPILSVYRRDAWYGGSRRAEGHVMQGGYTDKARDEAVEAAWNHFEERFGGNHARGAVQPEDARARWLRLYLEVTTVQVWESENYLYLTYDPAEWRRAIGFESDDQLPAAYGDSINMNEWRAYVEGDVYGIVIERETAITDLGGLEEDTNLWEVVDSLWGFYGDAGGYVTEEAEAMIRYAAEPIRAEAAG